MQMKTADLVDKAVILKIKFEHGLDCEEEMGLFMEATKEVPTNLVQELYGVNLQEWKVEDEISAERDSAKIGVLYLQLRMLNLQRIGVRNRIAAWAKEKPELKKY